MSDYRWNSMLGSSPQMRGARSTATRSSCPTGIIPADAGSTHMLPMVRHSRQDHPRRCGEHSMVSVTPGWVSGSSPQMRGARDGNGNRSASWRIIPADAGSTRSRCIRTACVPDHPRRCGEHSRSNCAMTANMGSSPQMRGARGIDVAGPLRDRIIPADAGSTFRPGSPVSCRPDHPRRCGEHRLGLPEISPRGGSSPQMRGAPRRAKSWFSPVRIIPADAGSTTTRRTGGRSSKDHPRRCGEHYTNPGTHWDECGSSPQMRGARILVSAEKPHLRIIPADVGSTMPTHCSTRLCRDHPRRCGEHT